MAIDKSLFDAFQAQLNNFKVQLKDSYNQFIKNKSDYETLKFKLNSLNSTIKADAGYYIALSNTKYPTQGSSWYDPAGADNSVIRNFASIQSYFTTQHDSLIQNAVGTGLPAMFASLNGLMSFLISRNIGNASTPAYTDLKRFYDSQQSNINDYQSTIPQYISAFQRNASSEKALTDLKSAIDGYLSQFAQYKADIANFPSYEDLLSDVKGEHPLSVSMIQPVQSVPIESLQPSAVSSQQLPSKGIDPKLIAAGIAAAFLFMRKLK